MSDTMMKSVRIRALRPIASCDGQTSVVVLAGTTGTAHSVNSPDHSLHEQPTTIFVYWDVVLLNQEDRESCVYTDWEDPAVPINHVEFIGIEIAPEEAPDQRGAQ